MIIRYDPETDALRIAFQQTPGSSRELADGIVGQYDDSGKLVGVDILEAGNQIGDLSSLRQVLLEGLGPPVAKGKPPSTIVANHIVLDEQRRGWIDDTNVKVIEVVLAKIAYGWDPEKIHEEYPHLSLAQIHAAFAYYYDHHAEFDAEIDRQDREYQARRAAQGNDSPLHRKLRAAGKLQ
jgi:uncharacterized protein (DUF433 family)/uncharacterized protein YuzE